MIKVHQQSTFFFLKSSSAFLLTRQLRSDILSYFIFFFGEGEKLGVFNLFQTDWLLFKVWETLAECQLKVLQLRKQNFG